jgi:uncharacterized membrane protein
VAQGKKPASRKPAQRGGRNGSSRRKEKRPGDYAKEAVAEWRKAAELGVAALSRAAASRGAARAKNGSAVGGRVVSAAGELLGKLGAPARLASKLGAGANGDAPPSQLHEPIQEAIDVAVPVRVAYALGTRFESYPEFLDRVEGVETAKDGTVSFEVRLRGHTRTVELEFTDERAEERIEWQTTEGPPSAGAISFHQLAPRLTHIELSVELEPEGIAQKLTRAAHLTERSIREELRRFKAYAELWQDEEEIEDEALEEEEERQDEGEEEQPEDDFDEEPEASEEDEYDDEFEEEPVGEAYVDESVNEDHHEAYEEVER